MKKIVFGIILLSGILFKAQNYKALNDALTRLEERRGVNSKDLENVNIDKMRFVIIKDFDDHTERDFVSFDGKNATYIEIFDDKSIGESYSNVFSGDIIRKKNVISLRADKLENKKIPVPKTKMFVLAKQKDILYLIDANTKDRWIDEKSFGKDKPQEIKKD